MRRTLTALAAAALFTFAASAASATTYIVYTSGFEVTSVTGCDYGGQSGSLVEFADGSEGCMVEAGMVAPGGGVIDAEEAATAELDRAVGGDDDGFAARRR